MKTNETALVIPFNKQLGGAWLRPSVARKYFNNGRGITEATLMNKIYSGQLLGKVKHDHTGWYVWVSEEAINTGFQPLKAA